MVFHRRRSNEELGGQRDTLSSHANSPPRLSARRTASPRSTMLGQSNHQASSFAPPPFAGAPTSSHRIPPPPPPRRSSAGHASVTSSGSAHQIIRITLQRPMGIVFAPNGELGYGVRIIDLPQQGAAAMSQQLCVGDLLVSVNEMDCTMSDSKEVLALIGQAQGGVDLAFLRTTSSVPVPAAAAAPSANNEVCQESTQSIKVVNLKWQDIPSRQSGRYSGMANQHMRPHGYGKFTSHQGSILEEEWDNGLFATVANDTGAANNDATEAAYQSDLRRQNSTSQRNECMSYATSFSDYANEQQGQQKLESEHSTEDSQAQYYCLGETLRSPQHMVQLASVEDTIQSVYALQISDFAFVKRSKGDWSFCQLIERGDNDEGEDVMTFCVNEVGHRKNLRPARWAKMVKSCSNGVTIRPGGVVYGNDMESEPSF